MKEMAKVEGAERQGDAGGERRETFYRHEKSSECLLS